MKLIITIDMDNDAFQDSANIQVACILEDLAMYLKFVHSGSWADRKLFDVNWNQVGIAEFTVP